MAQARLAEKVLPGRIWSGKRGRVALVRAGNGGDKGDEQDEAAAQMAGEKVTQRGAEMWTISDYFSKRQNLRTDQLGEIPSDAYDETKEPLGWDEEAKMTLAVEVVAEELGTTSGIVRSKIDELTKLLPGLEKRVANMKKAHLARLAASTGDVANKLVVLNELFPGANVGDLCARRPDVLVMTVEEMRSAAEKLRSVFEGYDYERMVENQPLFLNPEAVDDAVKKAGILMPNTDVGWFFERDPDQIMALQSRDNLIPYDNGSLVQVNESLKKQAGQDHREDLAAPEGW